MAGSTPIYGFPYPESSDLVANYPALGEQLAEDIESTISGLPAAGLSLVSPTSIANSGGSASASGGEVTFSAVTSLSLNGIFTSTYQTYRLIMSFYASDYDDFLRIRLRAAGTDNTTANSYCSQYIWSRTTTVYADQLISDYARCMKIGNGIEDLVVMDISNPQVAVSTRLTALGTYGGANNGVIDNYWAAMSHNQATSYDGITLKPSPPDTMTGKIRVYGYKNS